MVHIHHTIGRKHQKNSGKIVQWKNFGIFMINNNSVGAIPWHVKWHNFSQVLERMADKGRKIKEL